MNPNIEILEDWLATVMPRTVGSCLLDIGAYRGDFSRACLDRRLVGSAHLFEPNPVNLAELEPLSRDNPSLRLHQYAIGREQGERDFHCSSDPATGSVLDYHAPAGVSTTTIRVKQIPLDVWWKQQGRPAVSLIKIDTQGHDLETLRSAPELITQHRPWLVVELIIVPLYRDQTTAADLLAWAEESSYTLAGLFNEHRTDAGLIAFLDVVLIPKEEASAASAQFVARPTAHSLLQENAMLKQTCDERLALINFLHAEAEKRLRLVEELTEALQRRQQS